jgi:hypothetical protein
LEFTPIGVEFWNLEFKNLGFVFQPLEFGILIFGIFKINYELQKNKTSPHRRSGAYGRRWL